MIELPPIKKTTKKEYMGLVATAIENAINKKCLIIFFGSILTDKFNRTSDIDVAIFCKEKLSATELFKIEEAIENIPILRDIDLVDIQKVKDKEFLKNILKGKVWKNIPELWKDLEKHIENLKKL